LVVPLPALLSICPISLPFLPDFGSDDPPQVELDIVPVFLPFDLGCFVTLDRSPKKETIEVGSVGWMSSTV